MKKLIFILGVVILIGFSNNNKIITPLSKSKGFGPFNKSYSLCFESPKDSIFIQNVPLPKTNITLSKRVFHVQPDQNLYYLLRKGIIKKKYFDKFQKVWGIDTSRLTENFVDEGVLIAIGNLNDGTTVIYVDRNNNNRLDDEPPLYFSKFSTAKAEKNAMDTLKPVFVKCNIYNGSKIKELKVPIILNPYKGSLIVGGTWAKQHYLSVGVYEHRVGSLNINNIKYKIYVSNSNISTFYTNKISSIMFNKFDSKNTDDELIEYNLKEVINLDGYDIRVDSITYFGTKLFITKLGINNSREGFKIGDKAPNIKGADIFGNSFNLKDQLGTYILLDFWGTWCKPCLNEIPYLKKLREKHNNKLKIISIAFDTDPGKVKEFIKKQNMNWIHLYQSFEDTEIKNKYKVSFFPSTFLLDKDGVILFKNLRGENLINKIDSLIN